MELIVMCPKCGNKQKTMPRQILGSVKKCVYCGRSFVIHSLKNSHILQVSK